jgi:hypothetical protein
MTPGRPLYFLHIPKVAGTSLTALIDARHAPEEIFPGQLLGALTGETAESLRRFTLFRGHLGVLPPLLLGWDRVAVFTVLRDPAERALSHYAHARIDPAHYLYERLNEPGYGVSDFLRDPSCRPVIEGAQARWLGLDPAESEGFAPPVDPAYPLMREAAFELLPIADEDRLERGALATLERAAVVGVSERLPETVAALAAALGWDELPELPRLNRSATRPAVESLAPLDRVLLDELTALDQRLHRAASRRLDELLAAA